MTILRCAVSFVLVVSLAATPAAAQDLRFRSLNDGAALESDVRAFIQDYNAYREEKEREEKARSEAPPKPGEQPKTQEDAWRAERDQILNDLILGETARGARPADAVAERLAPAPSDSRTSRIARVARSIVGLSTGLPADIHNFNVATLMADYLEHPKNREAIELIMHAWEPRVSAEIEASYENPYVEWVSWGMTFAWVAIIVWDTRDGLQGLKTDGKQAVEALARSKDALLAKLRALRDSGEAGKETVKRMAEDPEVLKEKVAEVGQALVSLAKKTGSKARESVRQAIPRDPGGLERHAWQLARALAASGVRSWVIESREKKISPLEALHATQAFAVQRLQVRTRELADRFMRLKPQIAVERDHARAMTSLSALLAGDDGLESLEKQLRQIHESPTGRSFQGNLPWVDLDRRMKELNSKNWFEALRLPSDERYARFAADRPEFAKLLGEIQGEIDRAKQRGGYDEADALKYSIGPIALRLEVLRMDYEILAKKHAPAPAPAPAAVRAPAKR